VQDIPLLVEHFLRRHDRDPGRHALGFGDEALAALSRYAWPGNVRELANLMERLVVVVDGPRIEVKDLPLEIALAQPRDSDGAVEFPLHQAVDRFEREIVQRALARARGRLGEAARMLGLHRNSLAAKLARWKIRPIDDSS
jgi:DNA-binding NtrC family response regulator